MKARVAIGLILFALALMLAVGPGPVRGAQRAANPAPASVNASPGATAPWFTEMVDPSMAVGSHISVAIDPSGTTYISYYDATNKDLKMAKYVGKGGNCGGDSDWSCETVDDSSGDVGKHSSIAIDPTTNLPAIAYWNQAPYDLKLASAWSGGWDILSIDHVTGSYASLKIDVTGAAHIAYYRHNDPQGLAYAKHVGGGTGNCGGNNYQCDAIDTRNGMGPYPSLALDASGQPRIAYQDAANGGLWFAQPSSSGNCGPGETWGCHAISTLPDAGQVASLDVDSANIPHIASYDGSELIYAVHVGPNGNCGVASTWQCDAIDTMGIDKHTRDVSLAVDKAGLPIIAYHKYILNDPFVLASLNVARPAAALGRQTGNCGPQDLWQCDRIQDFGHSGDYAAIAVHPSGLATIAYLNTKYFGALKVAYQRFEVLLPLVLR